MFLSEYGNVCVSSTHHRQLQVDCNRVFTSFVRSYRVIYIFYLAFKTSVTKRPRDISYWLKNVAKLKKKNKIIFVTVATQREGRHKSDGFYKPTDFHSHFNKNVFLKVPHTYTRSTFTIKDHAKFDARTDVLL